MITKKGTNNSNWERNVHEKEKGEVESAKTVDKGWMGKSAQEGSPRKRRAFWAKHG
jgi:hypothetical protein